MTVTLRRVLLNLILLASVLSLGTSAGVAARLAQSGDGPRLRLHRTEPPATALASAALGVEWLAAAPGPFAIVQLRGPVTPADRAALEQAGLELLEYLPDFAFLVRGQPAQLEAVRRWPQVHHLAAFTLADKLAPPLLRMLARGETVTGPLRVVGWAGQMGAAAAPDVTAATITSSAELLPLAALDSVRWIEPATQPRLLNDVARGLMKVDTAWQLRQRFGAGQVVAVADSGLDTGNLGTLSPDFAGRLAATHILVDGADWGDNNGHGTHVAGSIASAGVQSGAITATHAYTGTFAGLAPEARLVIQAFEADQAGAITGLPDDFYVLFNQAYADGARLHSNSWGDYTGPLTDTEAAFGGYTFGSQRTDQFVSDHPDLTILAAAGNSGVDGTPGALGFCTGGDGVVDPDSLLAPGTAKNVITVGASESVRNSGGLSGVPWLLLNLCFFTPPIAADPISDNANGLAAFSSRGPTDDGRMKPDLVAPGTNILSNRSHYPGAGALWGAHDTNAHYSYSGGTSMATPLAAGLATLAREWLVEQGIANPSAALVKALLLNTTHDMAPGQYGAGATQEIPNARPNYVAGWGRADAGFMTAPLPYGLWVEDHAAGLSTGQTLTYTHASLQPLTVVTSTQPLRVMLVWTDPPASLSAAAQLVNDLDLTVIGPGGETYFGNGGAANDRINNVEGVIIASPTPGVYSVRVSAFNVPVGVQAYALVVAGPLNGAAPPPPPNRLYLPLVQR